MASPSSTAAQAFKAALRDAMKALVADRDDVLVVFGQPGQEVLNFQDLVMLEELTADQNPATFGTNRAREEVLTQAVVFECFRPGGPEAEETSAVAAYALLGLLENHVRSVDTTLGGVVRQCFLTSHRSQGFTSPTAAIQGRTTVIEAVFTANVRITS
jgi:hypothetical protein